MPGLEQPDKTVYTGEHLEREPNDRNRIVVSPPDEPDYLLPPRTDVEKISLNHPYDAFTWGYRGSGPHLTAGSLIADAYQDRETAQRNKQELVEEYVSHLEQGEGWSITAGEIHDILTE
ncbi:MAG: DUF6166 domain-containing protein [Candidatus Nanohaloarchaea archaeon]